MSAAGVPQGETTTVLVGLFLAVLLLPVGSMSPGGQGGASAPVEAATGATGERTARYVVDDDGGAAYREIGAALADAGAGDVVEVRPGTYREAVRVTADLTLVAPDGATLAGSTLGPSSTGIEIGRASDATIRGFAVVGFDRGVDAVDSAGDWTLEDLSIRDCERSAGVAAGDSDGAWRVESVRIENCRAGIVADDSTGNWVVRNVVIRASSADGLSATNSVGDWTVRRTTVRNSSYDGIDATESAGGWTVDDVTIRDTDLDALDARDAGGDWAVRGATLSNYSTGIDARASTGNWTVRGSTFEEGTVGLDARRTAGDWTLANATVRDSATDGVDARRSAGDWTIRNVTVSGSRLFGISAFRSTGEWSVRGSSVRETAADGIEATFTGGDWSVHDTAVLATALHGPYANESGAVVYVPGAVNATGADPAGSATRNWWGSADGPDTDDCLGNVDCGGFLTGPPETDPGYGPGVRNVSVESVPSGGVIEVTLTVEFDRLRESVSVQDGFEGPVEGTTVRSIEVDGDPIPSEALVFSNADEEGISLAIRDLPGGATLEVVYAVTVAGGGGDVTFVGSDGPDVASGDVEGEFGTDTVRVEGDPVSWADRDDDGEIATGELNAAIEAWAGGDLSTQALQAIIQAWATSG